MAKKLFVGGISFNASDEDLMDLFLKIGGVESAKIITDPQSGRSKGFGFVEMAEEDDASRAISDLNGTTFMERVIVVNEARPRQPKERKSFGGFGRKSGFDRDRGGFNKGRGTKQRRGRR